MNERVIECSYNQLSGSLQNVWKSNFALMNTEIMENSIIMYVIWYFIILAQFLRSRDKVTCFEVGNNEKDLRFSDHNCLGEK